MDNGSKTGAMIALLPITTDWCKTDLPHMTLVYAGDVTDHKPTDFNEFAKDASSIALLAPTIMLRVKGVEVYGEEEKVNVLCLQPTSELWAMRRMVEKWDDGSFPEFKPHATIGPFDQHIDYMNMPPVLAFDRVYVGWGEDSLTFLMKRA